MFCSVFSALWSCFWLLRLLLCSGVVVVVGAAALATDFRLPLVVVVLVGRDVDGVERLVVVVLVLHRVVVVRVLCPVVLGVDLLVVAARPACCARCRRALHLPLLAAAPPPPSVGAASPARSSAACPRSCLSPSCPRAGYSTFRGVRKTQRRCPPEAAACGCCLSHVLEVDFRRLLPWHFCLRFCGG